MTRMFYQQPIGPWEPLMRDKPLPCSLESLETEDFSSAIEGQRENKGNKNKKTILATCRLTSAQAFRNTHSRCIPGPLFSRSLSGAGLLFSGGCRSGRCSHMASIAQRCRSSMSSSSSSFSFLAAVKTKTPAVNIIRWHHALHFDHNNTLCSWMVIGF